MYVEEFPDMPVEYGFMEIRKPGIPETIKKLTSENDLEKIIVVPVFVAHGLHTKSDIPGLLGIESDFDEEDTIYSDIKHVTCPGISRREPWWRS